MSVDVAERLRSLAQDHHDGKLDLAAYRALRAPLLDSLSTTSAPRGPEITQPRGATRQPLREAITQPGKPRSLSPETVSTASAPAHQPAAPSISAVSSSGAQRPARFAIIIVIGLILVVAVALWMLFGRHGSSPTATQPGASAAGASSAEVIEGLVQSFVGAGDWSDARVMALNTALAEIGGSQIATVAHEGWFRQFVDALRRRLKEQQALSPTRLTVENSPLAALAVTVGIDLDSPDSAPHISPLPPPQPAETVKSANAAARPVQRVAPTGAGEGVADREAAKPDTAAKPGAATKPDTATKPDAATKPGAATRPDTATKAGIAAKSGAAVSSTPAQAAPPADSAASADSCRAELARSRRPLCHDVISGGIAGPEMAVVPAGAFDMGSTAAPAEQPVHHVTIGQPFAVSVYEVSQGEFQQFCDATHRACAQQPWSGDDYPVVNVSWDDARAYTDWLAGVTHHHYGLPTEAQWEYAARAGSMGLYPNGDSTLSPTDADYSVSKLQTVAARRSERFNANAFRLMHTIGNVREWVEDAWTQNYKGAADDGTAVRSTQAAMRVARGGSYADGASRLRLSLREGLAPGTRDVTTGFRVVRELP